LLDPVNIYRRIPPDPAEGVSPLHLMVKFNPPFETLWLLYIYKNTQWEMDEVQIKYIINIKL
jgi:hypothetical protein